MKADLMVSRLTTLTSADIQRFERDGYVVVRQAFSSADALAMERRWWSELEDTHHIRPDDRSSWRQIPGDLKANSFVCTGNECDGCALHVCSAQHDG